MKNPAALPPVVLSLRTFVSYEYKCTMYMVSVEGDGAPKDLLARGTAELALSDGAAYVAAKWGRTADGTWTPFSADWGRRFLTCRHTGSMVCATS